MAVKYKKGMTKGQWQVHRERCHIRRAAPPARRPQQEAIGDVLPGLMKRLGLDEAHWVETLSEEWGAIVGKSVGVHTRPGRIEGRRLTVFVDSSPWLNELKRYGRRQMLQNLQSHFGVRRIRDIRLQLDPDRRPRRRR